MVKDLRRKIILLIVQVLNILSFISAFIHEYKLKWDGSHLVKNLKNQISNTHEANGI